MISHSIAACLGFIQKNKKFLKFLCIWYIMSAKEKQADAKSCFSFLADICFSCAITEQTSGVRRTRSA